MNNLCVTSTNKTTSPSCNWRGSMTAVTSDSKALAQNGMHSSSKQQKRWCGDIIASHCIHIYLILLHANSHFFNDSPATPYQQLTWTLPPKHVPQMTFSNPQSHPMLSLLQSPLPQTSTTSDSSSSNSNKILHQRQLAFVKG